MKTEMRKIKMRYLLHLLTLVSTVLAAFFLGPATLVGAQGAWYGEYFANRDLAGGPAITRYDDKIDFSWGNGSPGAGIPSDGFSARWTRDQWFDGGTYRFSYRSDDGMRIWVGDKLVVDDWRERQASLTVVDYVVSQGVQRVRVEYFENTGGATAQVYWERATGGEGWRGEYYNNRELKGGPVLTRYDAAIDFDWKTGSPDPAVPADNFSVRWTRTLGFTAGTYRFYSSSDDGVRLYVDGKSIVDAWSNNKLPNTYTGDITLSDGLHSIVVEYYEQGGDASAHIWWNRLGGFSAWQSRYFDNPDLRGGPALVRDDAEINFDWGQGAPATWMPSDNFSAVWTRQVNFAPGYYRLNVRADDGVRVWLDNGLIMDYWQVQDYPWRYVDGTYLEGLHTIKVEYFERGGAARIHFWWDLSASAPSPVGPAPAPTPAPGVGPAPNLAGPWQGEYFNNASLRGTPALVRADPILDFDWGSAAPGSQIQRDNFSARWTGTFSFAAGRYSFNSFSDDGIRVYVDGQRVIDAWRPMRGSRSGSVDLSAGSHTVVVEYFERTGRANVRVSWTKTGAGSAASVGGPSAPVVTACNGGPLQLDAWAVAQSCTGAGWTATIFVQGHGGNCAYTYGWEDQIQGGPTSNSMTFQVHSAGWNTAITGEAWVTSGGQRAEAELFVPHPKCP
jgi:hypothetical protein